MNKQEGARAVVHNDDATAESARERVIGRVAEIAENGDQSVMGSQYGDGRRLSRVWQCSCLRYWKEGQCASDE